MGSSKTTTIIIIVLLVLLLGITGGLGFYLISTSKTKGESATSPAVGVNKDLSPIDIETVNISDPITTNLAEVDGETKNHMIQFDFSIGIDNTVKKESPEMIKLISEKGDIIKNSAIDIVSRKTHLEMKSKDAKNIFAKELLERLQDEFNTSLIVDIYIKDWKVV